MDVVTQFCRWISEQAEDCIQGRVRSDPGVKSAWSGEEEALPVWWPTWSLEHGPKENCWRAKVVSRTLLSVDYFCSHKTCVKWPERCQLQQWVRKNLPLESLRPDVWSLKICVKTWKNILKWSALKMLRWQMGKYKVSNFWTAVRPHTMNANWVCEYFLQHGKQRTHLEPVRTKRAACMWTRVGGLICAVLCSWAMQPPCLPWQESRELDAGPRYAAPQPPFLLLCLPWVPAGPPGQCAFKEPQCNL